ncbi:MAG: putative flavoprotein involved in transport [Bryobacterales bacterium]|nr:putative flavoprotein involved in transport [Bryobacterales bacterium]
MQTVAVIGAGPAGLVAARYLNSEGFEPVLFEQGSRIGGQWSGDPGHSGVWPGMRTNTSRIMTAFSDLPHDAGTPTYPTNEAMGEYLERYAKMFDLTRRIRFKTPVRELRRDADGWILGTDAGEERFARVVVATGRYHKPAIPEVAGLQTFSGKAGVNHTFSYKRPEDYRGLRVLVGGCAISSVEIASDLAGLGAARVVVTNRRQRYVLPKLVNGVPLDHMAFTRFSALSKEWFPMAAVGAGFKQYLLTVAGIPEQFGAPKPADDVFEAGITMSQFFLPLVAEGRISIKPWTESVDGRTVRFVDGSAEDFDGIVFGTGYHLDLPFLSDDLRQTLDVDAQHIDLCNFTFHPELWGLAFVGLYEQIGPYYPVLELQARWIAYTMSGAIAAPSKDELERGVAAYRARRGTPQTVFTDTMATLFARAAGVEPELESWPELACPLMFGPLTPISFRLSGRDSLADAPERFAADVRTFGCVPSNQLAPMQIGQLQGLAKARGDEAFSRYVATICPGAEG